MQRIRTTLMAWVTLSVVALGARAQGADFLYWKETPAATDVIFGALLDLGLTGDISRSVDQFLDKADDRAWPVIIIWRYRALGPTDEARVIDALRQHLDGGGRLLVNMPQLDDMPAMQRFLGLEGAIDLRPPQQRIRQVAVPAHPAVAQGVMRTSGEPPVLDDIGDVLVPGPDARPLLKYEIDETIASVMVRSGQVIVNGWEWSEWSSDGIAMATDQIEWLISCPVDVDGDGTLDLFDFLEFQSLFMAGDPAADWFDYDGRLTIFDFLAFFDAFEVGCP
ncbi:MAG: GC-type dockerin domain-anchored protein [Phycisphaerales bacterium]|jgi:hypothetical protein